MNRNVNKIKFQPDEKEYKELYPTESGPRLLYDKAKVHKFQTEERLKELKIRPIISNIGALTCEIAKCLNALLAPLGKSNFKIWNTECANKEVRKEKIPDEYIIISIGGKVFLSTFL